MYMTNEEILRLYRQGKDKKKQIYILADLNLCHRMQIVEILKDAGEPIRYSFTRRKQASA